MLNLESFLGLQDSAFVLARTIVTCAVIWLAGRALVSWLEPRLPNARFRHPAYVAIGAGAAAVTILTWLFQVLHIYSFAAMSGAVLAIGALGYLMRKMGRA